MQLSQWNLYTMRSSVALQEGLALSTSLEVKWDVMDRAATKSTVIGEHRKKGTLRISTVKGHILGFLDIFLWFNNKCFTALNSTNVPNINNLPTNNTRSYAVHTDLGRKCISFRCQAFSRWWIFQLQPQIPVVCKDGSGEHLPVLLPCSLSLQTPPFQEHPLWEAFAACLFPIY